METLAMGRHMTDDRTFGETLADKIAELGGSWTFIFLAAIFFSAWIALNTLAVCQMIAWDHYPFILLNLVLSFLAAFQAPVILMSQKRCERKQDQAYRHLFAEIKELVETDLSVEHELMELAKKQDKEIQTLKQIIHELQEHRQELQEHREAVEGDESETLQHDENKVES